mgnify:CR=1 FL=1
MTASERQATLSLASLYGLRMLGLFLVLPVFALEARRYPGGEDPVWLGLAMGIYGLTQGLLQRSLQAFRSDVAPAGTDVLVRAHEQDVHLLQHFD